MPTAEPDAVAFLTTLTAGAAMLWLGVKQNMLAVRSRTRRCPACGRLTRPRRACACSD